MRGIRLQHALCKENECAAVNSVCMSEKKFKKVFEMNPLIIGVNGNFHRGRSTRSSKCSFVFVIIILIIFNQNFHPYKYLNLSFVSYIEF